MPYWTDRGAFGYQSGEQMRSDAIRADRERRKSEYYNQPMPPLGTMPGSMWGEWFDRVADQQVPTANQFERMKPQQAGAIVTGGASAPLSGLQLAGQFGNRDVGANQKYRDISTAGRGQYDPALQGLQQLYEKSVGEQKEKAGAELRRRTPFQQNNPWSLG